MPSCDVCLNESMDIGVLACRHVVCRSCGMSQSKCLVCAEVVGKHRKRLGLRLLHTRTATHARPEDPVRRASSAEGSPKTIPSKPPHLLDMQLRSTRAAALKAKSPRALPNVRNSVSPDIGGENPILRKRKTCVSDAHEQVGEPPSKILKESLPLENENGIVSVQGPTAYDEVRCELRALGSAPKLSRSALRTSGKVSIALMSKFVHKLLQLPPSDEVIMRCSGEDLTGAMTMGQLVTHVWPEAEGHMILDYRIAQGVNNSKAT